MEYKREESSVRPPEERIHDWQEFHQPIPEKDRMQQGARCMNCGTPFCQNRDRTVTTEPDAHTSSVQKIFTAGDMRTGSSLVVSAIADGRAAAAEADRYLLGYTNLI